MSEAESLAQRWTKARRAALLDVLPEESSAAEAEDVLVVRALARDPEGALRRVFDNSRLLGAGFSRFHHTTTSIEEVPGLLSQLGHAGAPCLVGEWEPATDEPAVALVRRPCTLGHTGPDACDWWREAIAGLVLGLSGGLRHARHESGGRAGRRCVDVVYANPESPLRLGPIPADMRPALDAVARMAAAFDSTFEVRFLGLAEGVLHYQLAPDGRGQAVVEGGLRRRFPRLSLREVTPRPVLDRPFSRSFG